MTKLCGLKNALDKSIFLDKFIFFQILILKLKFYPSQKGMTEKEEFLPENIGNGQIGVASSQNKTKRQAGGILRIWENFKARIRAKDKFKEQRMDGQKEKEAQNGQIRRPLPAELLSEMFGCLPLANSYGLLAQMPNAILARNVRGVLNRTQMLNFYNKWINCGPYLDISANGMESTRSTRGPNRQKYWQRLGFSKKDHDYLFEDNYTTPNSVRAQMPVRIFKGGTMPKKPYITGYYEVVSIDKTISIGFSNQQFPLNKPIIGMQENSIGTQQKSEIHIDGNQYIRLAQGNGSRFRRANDVMGCGIVHFPQNDLLKFFFTCNAQLLGSAILPPKFLDMPLYPCASMWSPGDSIRANFGKQKFRANLVDILAKLMG